MGYGDDQLDTTGLDPQIHSGTVAESKLRNCYDCLVQISKDMKGIEPQLATEWKRLNPTTMQFKLRPTVGVRSRTTAPRPWGSACLGESYHQCAVRLLELFERRRRRLEHPLDPDSAHESPRRPRHFLRRQAQPCPDRGDPGKGYGRIALAGAGAPDGRSRERERAVHRIRLHRAHGAR